MRNPSTTDNVSIYFSIQIKLEIRPNQRDKAKFFSQYQRDIAKKLINLHNSPNSENNRQPNIYRITIMKTE